MGYDLLIAGDGEMQITTLPFFWLARLLARLSLWAVGSGYASITRGRHDIIWRHEIPTR